MKIKLGIDVNITRVKSKSNLCSFCNESMLNWGVSFGSKYDYNHDNAWIHLCCIKELSDFISKYNIFGVKKINFDKKGISIGCGEEKYCSYCGKKDNGNFVISRKLFGGSHRATVYCHINCLKELANKTRGISYQGINDKFLVEDI